MITTQELQALVELLSRAPMTQAEKLWAQTMVDKLAPKPETVEEN